MAKGHLVAKGVFGERYVSRKADLWRKVCLAKGMFRERLTCAKGVSVRKADLCERCVCAKGMSCAKGVWRKVLSARRKFSILGCECHEPNQASDMFWAINLRIFKDQ